MLKEEMKTGTIVQYVNKKKQFKGVAVTNAFKHGMELIFITGIYANERKFLRWESIKQKKKLYKFGGNLELTLYHKQLDSLDAKEILNRYIEGGWYADKDWRFDDYEISDFGYIDEFFHRWLSDSEFNYYKYLDEKASSEKEWCNLIAAKLFLMKQYGIKLK